MSEEEALRREVQALRTILAYEARVVEAQTLDLKALGKGRREQLEACVGRMRSAVLSGAERTLYSTNYLHDPSRELKNLERPAPSQRREGR